MIGKVEVAGRKKLLGVYLGMFAFFLPSVYVHVYVHTYVQYIQYNLSCRGLWNIQYIQYMQLRS